MKHIRATQIAVSAGALIFAAVHTIWPSITLDVFSATMLIVAIAPWLAPILDTVKLPGGLEIKLRELQKQVDRTKGEVASAVMQAQVALAGTTGEPQHRSLGPGDGNSPTAQALEALADSYEIVRNNVPSGGQRTAAMTDIFGKMLSIATQIPTLELKNYLTSERAGNRLIGYAFAHAHPDAADPQAVIDSLTRLETKPFGQYWALRALRRVTTAALAARRAASVPSICAQLDEYLSELPFGTDRYYEASQLMLELGCKRQER